MAEKGTHWAERGKTLGWKRRHTGILVKKHWAIGKDSLVDTGMSVWNYMLEYKHLYNIKRTHSDVWRETHRDLKNKCRHTGSI